MPPSAFAAGRVRLCPLITMAALVALASATCGGQPAPVPLPEGVDLTQPVTVADCVRIALAINPALAIAQNGVRQATAAVTQTRAAQLPSLMLDGGASATKTRGSGTAPGGGSPSGSSTTTSWSADLLLSQTIFQSGLQEGIGSAKASAQASRLGYDDVRRTVSLDVARSYYTALAARALVDVAARALGSSNQHVELTRAKIAQEVAAQADLYPFEVEVAQARLQVITAESLAQTTLTTLKEAIGLPVETSLQLAEALGRPSLAEQLPDLLAAAYRNRPDILRQQALVRSAQLSARVAEIERGPVLNVGGDASYGVAKDNSGSSAQVQAGVTLPIFDGGLTRARAESARAGLDSASQSLQQLQLGVGAEVERSYLNAVEANNRIDAAETAVRAAEVSLDAAEGRYAAGGGVGTVIDVTDAEVRLRQAEADRVRAYYDYNTALAALRAATGQLAVPEAP